MGSSIVAGNHRTQGVLRAPSLRYQSPPSKGKETRGKAHNHPNHLRGHSTSSQTQYIYICIYIYKYIYIYMYVYIYMYIIIYICICICIYVYICIYIYVINLDLQWHTFPAVSHVGLPEAISVTTPWTRLQDTFWPESQVLFQPPKLRIMILSDLAGGFKHGLFSISYMGCHPSHWLSYFSRWLKPPTRDRLTVIPRKKVKSCIK